MVASGIDAGSISSHFDSISVCFSKGLGAPVGSALPGRRTLIGRARRFRELFGGAMCQAGIVAAGTLHALANHLDGLAEDHVKARLLASNIVGMEGVRIDPDRVETNIVMVDLVDERAGEVAAGCRRDDLLLIAMGDTRYVW
ncbi:MAG: hypothetical protein KDG54_10630 [Geminicoccaceae bacterium]|nr:hypothetical protein [Geminicoccaceae bacterium]